VSLPGLLGEIERIAGKSAATRLALHAGGTEMKFSANPKSALAKIVGADAAKAIAAELGGEKYTIPMAHIRGQKGRRAQAAKMLADGASANDAAKACDIHERTARRVREKLKHKRDLPLFPED
jgi:hypothetical protein